MTTPLLLLPLLQALAGQTGQLRPPDSGVPSRGDQAALLAMIAAMAQPALPAEPVRLPVIVPWVAGTVVLGYFALLATIVVMLLAGSALDGAPLAALLMLAVGLGALTAKFGTVIDFLFGSSLGSRQKDAWRPQEGYRSSPPTPVPLPHLPAEKPPAPVPEPPTGDPFERCHAVVAKWEGGYSNHPSDPGGPTNYGITQEVLGEWRGQPVTAADVRALSREEALQIFRARYWEPLRCAEMQIAIALLAYNAGVNSGIRRGAKFLQACLNKQGAGLDEDGEVGPKTLAAAAKADMRRLIEDYADRYESYYRTLPTFQTFGRGWLNRLADVKATALAWADEPAPDISDKPTTTSPKLLSTDEVKAAFGDFTYTESSGGRIRIDPAWVEANIIEVDIPQLAPLGVRHVQVHRKVVDELKSAFAEIEAAGLTDRLVTWDGSFVPRHMTWNAARPLSRHSWGIAFDVNAAWNGYGSAGAAKGEHGSVVELVPIFERHGFAWGGRWATKDPMHFEYARSM